MGRRLNLRNPRTFDEKLHWLNLYQHDPRRAQLADKYAARQIVAARLGPDALNQLYGVWDRAEDVPFEQLPESFVLKVTAGCGWNILCPDKSNLNVAEARNTLAGWLNTRYYLRYRERPYRDMKPRIVCERFLRDEDGQPPRDYKFFCFGGEPRFVQVDLDRFGNHTRKMYDTQWRPAPFLIGQYPACTSEIAKPDNLENLVLAAAKIAAGFPFARVDLYSVANRVIFGETTWFPAAGFNLFDPPNYGAELGKLIDLPTRSSWFGGNLGMRVNRLSTAK
jgi:hypothetical protein